MFNRTVYRLLTLLVQPVRCRKTCLFVVLMACGVFASAGSGPDPETLESALRQRVEARWQALIEHDFRRAYEYQTPAYRELYSYEHFGADYARGPWLTARVVDIDLPVDETSKAAGEGEASVVAKVSVLVEIQVVYPGSSAAVRADSMLSEKWIYLAGEWWYVE